MNALSTTPSVVARLLASFSVPEEIAMARSYKNAKPAFTLHHSKAR